MATERTEQARTEGSGSDGILARDALSHIHQVIGLIDKNRLSPTYGCLDRNFWHYKTIDFPTGMAQLGVLSLALVHAYPLGKALGGSDAWQGNPRIRELAIAGMRYLPKCSHKDGSADEFYPFERALGATAFPLIAATEAFLALGLSARDHPDIVAFFKRRADWLIHNIEPAAIANHLAGAALAIINVYLITREKRYLHGAQKKVRETMAHMNPEGWFQEYDGCDIGYLTFTVDYLVKYYRKTGDRAVLPVIEKAIGFCAHFLHPDGSFAGEYGSRNTAHFLPAGFALIRDEIPLAGAILDAYLDGMAHDSHEHMDDEKYFFYNVNNYLQAYLYAHGKRGLFGLPGSKRTARKGTHHPGKNQPLPCRGPDFAMFFKDAQLYVRKLGPWYCVMSLAKGGSLKLFKGDRLAYTYTGLLGTTHDKTQLTTQLFDSVDSVLVDDDEVLLKGHFQQVFYSLQTTDKFFMLRSLMLTLGRSWTIGSAVKRLLVRKLITKKKHYTKSFSLSLRLSHDQARLCIDVDQSAQPFTELYETTDLALIQVPTSRYALGSNLRPWTRIDCAGRDGGRGKDIRIERTIK